MNTLSPWRITFWTGEELECASIEATSAESAREIADSWNNPDTPWEIRKIESCTKEEVLLVDLHDGLRRLLWGVPGWLDSQVEEMMEQINGRIKELREGA